MFELYAKMRHLSPTAEPAVVADALYEHFARCVRHQSWMDEAQYYEACDAFAGKTVEKLRHDLERVWFPGVTDVRMLAVLWCHDRGLVKTC